MESFFSLGESLLRHPWNFSSLKNFNRISPLVQRHLKLVYAALSSACVASAVGAYVHLLWNVGGLLTALACVGSIAWLIMTPIHEEKKKMSLLMAAGLFEGASIGPLIELAIEIDPSIVISAFVGTAIAFCCYSAAAAYSRSLLEDIYLVGLLLLAAAVLPYVFSASSASGGHVAMFTSELFFGLVLFSWYIMKCSSQMIERIDCGDDDYVKHALILLTIYFTDVFVSIFKIPMELRRSAEKDKKKSEGFNLDFNITFRLRGGLE